MQFNMLAYFEQGAARAFPDKVAIVDGATRLTFAELERRAKRFAAMLVARADMLNQPVAVYLSKCADTVATARACVDEVVAAGIAAGRIALVEELDDSGEAGDTNAVPHRVEQVIDTDPLCIIDTSGSTGAVLRHRGTMDFMDRVFDTFPLDEPLSIGYPCRNTDILILNDQAERAQLAAIGSGARA